MPTSPAIVDTGVPAALRSSAVLSVGSRDASASLRRS
jgi:hypothetical protein